MRRALPILASFAVLLAGVLAWWLAARFGAAPGDAPPEARLGSLAGAAAWWNGPVADDSLRGRAAVVLLWSDADPRASAALATLSAWHAAYAPLGARVVAVHVPEYAYAADTAVAGRIVRRERLAFPVASDPAGAIAARFGGATEGPRVVVADETGRIVADGIADLATADAALRAWAERARGAAPPAFALPALARVTTVRLGAGEAADGPLKGLPAGYEGVFTAEFRYQEQGRRGTVFPVGGWRVRADGLEATRGGAANFAAIRYSAARAGVVVSPPPGARGRLWILLDDRWPPPERRGADVAAGEQGAAYVEFAAPGLYWIEQGRGERVLKLSPGEPGVTLHALVFEGADE